MYSSHLNIFTCWYRNLNPKNKNNCIIQKATSIRMLLCTYILNNTKSE